MIDALFGNVFNLFTCEIHFVSSVCVCKDKTWYYVDCESSVSALNFMAIFYRNFVCTQNNVISLIWLFLASPLSINLTFSAFA